MEERRHGGGHGPAQGHRSRDRRRGHRGAGRRRRHAASSRPPTKPRGPSCGRATARPRARRSSTSQPGTDSSWPYALEPRGRGRPSSGQRRGARLRAVEERRHAARDGPGQGHRPGGRRPARTCVGHERHRDAVLQRDDGGTGRRSCGRATAPPPAPCWSTSGPGPGTSTPRVSTNVNGTLFFRLDDGATGASCGRATAPPPAPCSSRTSSPARPGRS